MNKYVLALTATALTASVVAPVANANELAFKDLAGYAQDTTDAVQLLVDKKIVNGTSATTFSPNAEITRGQVVKILGRYLQNVEGKAVPADWNTKARFSDVPVAHKDEELVKLAALCFDAGIFTGNEGKLMTSGTMSRENLALVVNRLAKQISGDKDLVALAAGLPSKVSDLNVAKEESRAAITALNALNISNVETFNPKGTVKRVHFASLFAKLLTTLEQPTPEEPTTPVVDEAVKAFEEAILKADAATIDAAAATALVAQYEALTAAQKASLSQAVQQKIQALVAQLAPTDTAVAAFEQTVTALNVEAADEATLKAVIAAYGALTAEQQKKLSQAVLDKVQAAQKKLETPPATGGTGGGGAPTASAEEQAFLAKLSNVGSLVVNNDVAVTSNGKTVEATVKNDQASLSSFLNLYNSLVKELGIVSVNGSSPTSFTTIGYLMELSGSPDNLGALKGKTLNIPVTVNNTGSNYTTTLTLVVK